MDNLTNEIFSILETNFLFGDNNNNKAVAKTLQTPINEFQSAKHVAGKVRILSIDGGASTDGILAAQSLSHLEASLRRKSGNPNAHISDFFDVVAGSGAGGILAALLFTRGENGRPIFTAGEALRFLVDNRKKLFKPSSKGFLKKFFNSEIKLLKKVFGECTLKDTLKSVLIPCFDLRTGAPFLFSRADAIESDGFDFKVKDVCVATSAVGAVEMGSVDGRTKIVAVDGGIAMNNPTASAITHVLYNKQEFPFCNGVEDLLVVSLGNGESDLDNGLSSPARFVRIATDGSSDMVDQAVSMAFGECRQSNYVRIQANGLISKKYGNLDNAMKSDKKVDMLAITEEMLKQKNVESVLFKGKKMVESNNLEKLELFAGELIKEQGRRKTSFLPTVLLKQASPSPRTSSATSLSTMSSC